jgi:hypothetical protein
MAAQFLRARAWWRLDRAGPSAVPVARSVVSLLDAAAYVQALPDDDPGLAALDDAGCFASGVFDPGPEGWLIVRDWQLAEEATAGPEDLLAQLAEAAHRDGPAAHRNGPAAHLGNLPESGLLADPATIIIPRQLGPAAEPAANR